MERPLVLVVDPLKSRLERLCTMLRRRYEVVGVRSPATALETTLRRAPVVVCVALRQPAGSGLEVAQALRLLPLMDEAAFIVFGKSKAGLESLKAQKEAKQKYGVHHLLVGEIDFQDLVKVAWAEVHARRTLRDTGPRPLPEDATIGDVMKRDASWEAFKVLLTTDVVQPTIDDLSQEDVDALSWRELLLARCTLQNIQLALRKRVSTGWGGTESS